ncbi:MAG TPA: sugar isomerase [Parachlamydiales bacterium]|nr:sugar isomerase [Parachlamydiales bacterium]
MFAKQFLAQTSQIINKLDLESIEKCALILKKIREDQGRLFFIGSGGGAGHASHATCDFRKLGRFEAYCPLDNISELTARINDDGWDSSLANYLTVSKLNEKDGLFIFSVGGGSEEKKISTNLVEAIKTAKNVKAKIIGIVGKDGGYTAKQADACIIVPTIDRSAITPHTEGFQAILWHLLISHPELQIHSTKWESVS